jgi:hypothetical protein
VATGRDTLASLQRLFEFYMTHHDIVGMPPDTNITENVIKQLSKKLRLIEGLRHDDLGGDVLPAAGRLLPVQALHRLVSARRQRAFPT